MNVNKLVPGMAHVAVEYRDGAVCGVLIIQARASKKFYIGYRANLYDGVNTVASALRNGHHANALLQEAHHKDVLDYFTFPTDTVGEAMDLRNSIIDEFAQMGVILNTASVRYTERVQKQVARFPARRSSKVIVDGVSYDSRQAAALAHGFTVSTVAYRIKHAAYTNWTQA
jgi:hypothetical protein